MNAAWKLVVATLVAYALFVTYKLESLVDAAYSLAHEARFSSIESQGESLSDTQWGAADLGQIRSFMFVVAAVTTIAVIAETVRAVRAKPAA